MGARSAHKRSDPLRRARLCASWPAETDVNGGHGFVDAFLGVKGSPVQIRPSRRRSKAGSGFQLPAFGCNGSARALPSIASTKRSGVSCRPGMLTSDYWHSARPRAGSRPLPADSGELSSRSRGRRCRSGRQRQVLGNNSRRRAAPTSGRHLVPSGSSPPRVHGLRMIIATAGGQPADLPAGGHPPHRSSRPLAGPVQPSLGRSCWTRPRTYGLKVIPLVP
jgi:hypothetical protein